MFSRILVPLDGSKLAEQVFPIVSTLARAFNPEIFLLSVCEPEEADSEGSCRLYLGAEAERLKKKLGNGRVKVYQTTLEGKPPDKIVEYAREKNADIVVASSHGSSGLKPWPLGSTVNRLLHERIPILVVRVQENPPCAIELFSRVLVPLDGTDVSLSALEPLRQISEKIESGIVFLEVVEKEHHVHTIGGLDYVPYLDTDLDTKETTASKFMKEAALKFKGSLASVKTEVRLGSPAEEILKLAAEIDATLIVLASHVHSAIERWFYGSVTQKIVQTAGRSFLLIPTNQKE